MILISSQRKKKRFVLIVKKFGYYCLRFEFYWKEIVINRILIWQQNYSSQWSERASSLLWGGMKLRIMTNINNSLTQFDPSIYHDHLRLVNSQIITFTTTIQFYRTFEVCFYWWYIFLIYSIYWCIRFRFYLSPTGTWQSLL